MFQDRTFVKLNEIETFQDHKNFVLRWPGWSPGRPGQPSRPRHHLNTSTNLTAIISAIRRSSRWATSWSSAMCGTSRKAAGEERRKRRERKADARRRCNDWVYTESRECLDGPLAWPPDIQLQQPFPPYLASPLSFLPPLGEQPAVCVCAHTHTHDAPRIACTLRGRARWDALYAVYVNRGTSTCARYTPEFLLSFDWADDLDIRYKTYRDRWNERVARCALPLSALRRSSPLVSFRPDVSFFFLPFSYLFDIWCAGIANALGASRDSSEV